jgi:tetratricopeptide (TPR) repeat protein
VGNRLFLGKTPTWNPLKESRMSNADIRVKTRVMVILVTLLCTPQVISANDSKALSTRTLRSMCRAYMVYGKYDKARILAEKAAVEARTQNVETGEQALCLIDLGTVYSYEDMLEDAAKAFGDGIVLQKKALSDQHPYVAHTLRMLSDVYRRQNRLEEAEATLQEAVSIMLKHTRTDSQEMVPYMIGSAQIAAASDRFEESRNIYEAAQRMAMASYGPNHLYTAQIIQGYAEVALTCRDFQNAQDQIARSIQIQERILGKNSQLLIAGWLAGARINRVCGALGESESYLQKAISVAQQCKNIVTIARVYEKAGAIRSEGIYTASLQSRL